MPPMITVMEIVVKEVSERGDIRAEFSVTEVKVERTAAMTEASAAELQQKLHGLVGLKGSTTITDRGHVRDADFTVPAGADTLLEQMMNGMRDSLRQLCSPLPEEPVGSGAAWRVEIKPTMNGIKTEQTIETRLTGLTPGAFSADLAITQHAARQKIVSPLLPAGTSMDLLSLESKGHGDIDADLGSLIPRKSGVILDSRLEFDVSGAEGHSRMKQRMHMSMTVRPVAAKEADAPLDKTPADQPSR